MRYSDARLTFELDYWRALCEANRWRVSKVAAAAGQNRQSVYLRLGQLGLIRSRDKKMKAQSTRNFVVNGDFSGDFKEARQQFERIYFDKLLVNNRGHIPTVAKVAKLDESYTYKKLDALGLIKRHHHEKVIYCSRALADAGTR